MMPRRWIAGALGALNALNGAFMLVDGARWYDSVPGLAHTGPYNPHFAADIGAAYFVAGLTLVARAWRPRYWPAAIAGAAFLLLHAGIHVLDLTMGRSGAPAVDVALVILPALIAAWAAAPSKREAHR